MGFSRPTWSDYRAAGGLNTSNWLFVVWWCMHHWLVSRCLSSRCCLLRLRATSIWLAWLFLTIFLWLFSYSFRLLRLCDLLWSLLTFCFLNSRVLIGLLCICNGLNNRRFSFFFYSGLINILAVQNFILIFVWSRLILCVFTFLLNPCNVLVSRLGLQLSLHLGKALSFDYYKLL